ncbi:MAG: hypothetical protein P4M11_04335 [Candidatus Pacebacteria bacterium]|nr:hypothetical protein [Candidatus Paceibacterota bacterium]
MDSLYSSLIPGLTRLHSIFLSLLSRLSVSSDTIDYLIIGFSAFDLFICLAVDWVLGKFIEKYEDKVMHIFLEMPRKYMIQLNAQCESFVGELQVRRIRDIHLR